MLIRIVRMTFKEDKVDAFLEIFNNSKSKIRSFPGCRHLELHRDYNKGNIYITYSHCDDESCLNAYRNSPLFSDVWKSTKALFSEPPRAFSNKLEDGPIE